MVSVQYSTPLREEVAREFNPQNPRQAILDMVSFTADYEISAFLKGIIGLLPVNIVLKQSANTWNKFYRPGKMVAKQIADHHVSFELTGFTADRLFCPVIDAWLTTAGKNMSLKEVKVKETACIHEGDELCRWEVSWS